MNVSSRNINAFTLVELMAVVLVIVVLSGIILGVTGYVQRRLAISTTKAQLVAMEAAIESYKSDWGFYPMTSVEHFSVSGNKEGSNNWYLYRALSGATGGKRYMAFSASMVRSNMQIPQVISGTTTSMNYGLFDPWGTLYNYYCSPTTAFGIGSSNTIGGQVNGSSYDLFSYGPDKATFIITNAPFSGNWTKTASADDDITNWK